MKMENKRAAQERRAKERAKKQAKQTAVNWIITIAIIAVVALVIVLIVRGNTGSKNSATSSSTATTSVSSEAASSSSSATESTSTSAAASGRNSGTTLNTTAGTVVNKGDTAAIHYVGKTSDGIPFYGGTGDYDLELGSGSFIPGFEDQVEGHSVGETFDVNVTFPENYSSSYAMDANGNPDTSKEIDLAGQPAVFTVTINGVY